METFAHSSSHYYNQKTIGKLGSFILLISFLLPHLLFAQVVLQFPNGGANGVYTSGGSGAGTVGAIYEWPNVGTEGAVTIKATITISAIIGGATLTTIDGASTAADWEPQVTGPQITSGNEWGMEFQIDFFDAADDSPYNLSALRAQGIDIDGGGGTSKLREFNSFMGADSYTLETPTELTAAAVIGGHRFTSSVSSFNGISIAQTQFIASCDYSNVNSITVACGVHAEGGTVNATNRLYSINFRNVVVFADPIVESVVLLPVELTNFEAEVINHATIQLDWSTASEINNDYFSLERRSDGSAFQTIGIINGSGSTIEKMNYRYIDQDPIEEISYYRLKQTDFDGNNKYSETISIDNRVHSKEISFITNLFGVEVNSMYRGIVIVIYEDGTSLKMMQ